ncbi:fermentative lactate dehydrogenase LdhA [Thermosynechococcus sp. NK55a]|jgi:D-lactate dehydrogenase|uniref:2-hydroxyacid dehydrogenase n=1 Tax=Thermosynechococcus sp. NK55a TaxID=1394889 RepID=UPI0003D7EE54|nr:2-hydroxyacid dehydrogenase [Thermosynechococcus sp. NK55a]AHB89259.1 fermentative lactate dehydrogenase LdhA [Thermosynechococcus sp. NK55a]
MKVAVFSAKSYDRQFLDAANAAQGYPHILTYYDLLLRPQTVSLAEGHNAICAFVNDDLGAQTLERLAQLGVRLVTLRCTGFNNVDLATAANVGITVTRVSTYSPYSVAEHTVGLILMLNRKLHRAYNRVRDDNFSLEGLMGFDLHGCTVGIIGTGKIGRVVAQILHGFGCHLYGYDPYPSEAFREIGTYTTLETLLAASDIITLHCPLLPENEHLINATTIAQMKRGVMLINTSRGKLVDTKAVIEGIKSGQIGYLGIDVYEEEDSLFFQDLSDTIIQDDTFQLLQSFPNVVITAHQAFFTRNALTDIARTTIENLTCFEQGLPLANEVKQPSP